MCIGLNALEQVLHPLLTISNGKQRMILRYLIVTQAVLLTGALLVGCVAPTSPSPLPTPTTVEGSLLSTELIADGAICVELENEYQLFFANSEAVWNEAWSELKDRLSINPDESVLQNS